MKQGTVESHFKNCEDGSYSRRIALFCECISQGLDLENTIPNKWACVSVLKTRLLDSPRRMTVSTGGLLDLGPSQALGTHVPTWPTCILSGIV